LGLFRVRRRPGIPAEDDGDEEYHKGAGRGGGAERGGSDAAPSKNFVAGNLHRFAHLWARICSKTVVGTQVIRWATDGVDVHDFFVPFVGKFNGRNYRSLIPPRTQFRNHLLSPAHESFVSSEIQRELQIGAVRRWGTVGEVKPPLSPCFAGGGGALKAA
jgi:hypothetical protein